MSCYFRHMKETFAAAGITITAANKRMVDEAIHRWAGVPYKHCWPMWRKVRPQMDDPKRRADLTNQLKRLKG